MRYDAEEFGAFVEMSDTWTRAEMRAFANRNGDEFWALLVSKITGVCIPVIDGEPITDPAALADDSVFDGVDIRLWQWFQNIPLAHVGHITKLGEALGLALFSTRETTPTQTTPTTPTAQSDSAK